MEIKTDPITLYKRDAKRSLQIWRIWAEDDEIWIEWGQENGETQSQSEEIDEGKAGRTVMEQVFSRINSRVEKKLDKGYVRDRHIALTRKAVNRLGLPRPMLAKPYGKVKGINFDASFLQYKYDGHRCLIHRDMDGNYTAYSRNGKPITSIREILEQVKKMGLQEGYTLDGELYCHGNSLQRITSWVKRRQPATRQLVYMVYDVIPNRPVTFSTRIIILDSLKWTNLDREGHSQIHRAPTGECVPKCEIPGALKGAIEAGYEGLILRRDTKPYEDGKRSDSLVKIKQWIVDEFLVVDIIPSREGYAILQCVTKDGKRFGATAPGTENEKFRVMKQRHEYLGRHIQLQFACWTDEKKPFHPIATMWREKHEE